MRILIWLLLLGGVFWAVHRLTGAASRGPAHRRAESEEMVRDPRCGVYLPVSSALSKRVRGKTVYFCSRECEEQYRKHGARNAN